jgi:hypothetical protein
MSSATVALKPVLLEDQEEPLLDLFSPPPVNKKVEACKESLYSALVGGAWGLCTSVPISALAYANSGVVAHMAVVPAASTVAGVAGGLIGTAAKNLIRACNKRPFARAFAGGYGSAAIALAFYNAMMWGFEKSTPVYMQAAIGVPAALVGAITSGCLKPRFGRLLSGLLTTTGTGGAIGVGLGCTLSLALPQVGQKAGPVLGLLGTTAICGYIIAAEKWRWQ